MVVESFDLAAARELFQLVNGRPGTLEELSSVVLTWTSPARELELFFQGKRNKKVLYINGCLLPQTEKCHWTGLGMGIGSSAAVVTESHLSLMGGKLFVPPDVSCVDGWMSRRDSQRNPANKD